MSERTVSLNTKTLPVRDDGTADTIFTDGIHGLSVIEGTVVLNLTRTTVSAAQSGSEPDIYIDTVARLAIPITAFARMSKFFSDNLAKFEKDGLFERIERAPEDGTE